MFSSALKKLEPDEEKIVGDAFASWSTDPACAQVGQNIAAETALTQGDFVALLRRFAAELSVGRVPTEAWKTACRAHKFKGRRLGSEDCPGVLGRAVGVKALANSIADTFGEEFTQGEAERLLWIANSITSRSSIQIV